MLITANYYNILVFLWTIGGRVGAAVGRRLLFVGLEDDELWEGEVVAVEEDWVEGGLLLLLLLPEMIPGNWILVIVAEWE